MLTNYIKYFSTIWTSIQFLPFCLDTKLSIFNMSGIFFTKEIGFIIYIFCNVLTTIWAFLIITLFHNQSLKKFIRGVLHPLSAISFNLLMGVSILNLV